MIIASNLMGIGSDEFTKAFIIMIQLGTILSVVVLYFKRFVKSFQFYIRIGIAALPALAAGLIFKDEIDALLDNVTVVAVSLVVGGVFLILLDWIFKPGTPNQKNEPGYKNALIIGTFQLLALIPGVSRSASTIAGGLSQRLSRKAAAEFSFFLAVPMMVAVTAYKIYKFYDQGVGFSNEQIGLLAIGNLVGFAVAIVAMRFFVNFLTRHGFKWFGYYRIFVGLLILGLLASGVDLTIV